MKFNHSHTVGHLLRYAENLGAKGMMGGERDEKERMKWRDFKGGFQRYCVIWRLSFRRSAADGVSAQAAQQLEARRWTLAHA